MKRRYPGIAFVMVALWQVTLAQPSAERPFADRSLWNAQPVAARFDPTEIPKAQYFPTIEEGSFSVGVFTAAPSDGPETIAGPTANEGIYIADAEATVPQIVIPHWPRNVVPAAGGDGHADIVDAASGIIHSFYQLRSVDGKWRAKQYAWAALDGRGWGEPAHYYQGARATGVPTMAGLIRIQELNDGQPIFHHALAMSMALNGLSRDPAYVFPATSADASSEQNHRGAFPEGSLMMLPKDFDVATIKDARLQKVARTLQIYGAYVVDENGGSPFEIYVEHGSGFSLMPPGRWDNDIADALDRMRAALRRVVAVGGWKDANGVEFIPDQRLNLLSMRGPWTVVGAGTAGAFDSWQQAVVFPGGGASVTQVNATGRSMHAVTWAIPAADEAFRLKVSGTKGAHLRLVLVDRANQTRFDSGMLRDGAAKEFKWPSNDLKPVITVGSGPNGDGMVSATLVSLKRTTP